MMKDSDDMSRENEIANEIESAYWKFDAAHKGLGKYKGHPQSERDAYKTSVWPFARKLIEAGR